MITMILTAGSLPYVIGAMLVLALFTLAVGAIQRQVKEYLKMALFVFVGGSAFAVLFDYVVVSIVCGGKCW